MEAQERERERERARESKEGERMIENRDER